MNADFNLQDLIYFNGLPGKVVGLLQGGEQVILLVDGNNQTVPYDHPGLLTLKQKKHRDAIKANNAQMNANITNSLTANTQAERPASRDVEPLGQVDKPKVEAPAAEVKKADTPVAPKAVVTEVPVNPPTKAAPVIEKKKAEIEQQAKDHIAPEPQTVKAAPAPKAKAPEAKIENTSSLNGADTKPE